MAKKNADTQNKLDDLHMMKLLSANEKDVRQRLQTEQLNEGNKSAIIEGKSPLTTHLKVKSSGSSIK